jgi:predicted RNase H-like nuclease (RuvC/YqgF family)
MMNRDSMKQIGKQYKKRNGVNNDRINEGILQRKNCQVIGEIITGNTLADKWRDMMGNEQDKSGEKENENESKDEANKVGWEKVNKNTKKNNKNYNNMISKEEENNNSISYNLREKTKHYTDYAKETTN